MRRLSPDQYRQVVADIFGPTIEIGGRFMKEPRENGLLAIGAGKVSITTTELEQYTNMARSIAAQVVDPRHRDALIPCKPASATAPDDACTNRFISTVGPLLYRRPLSADEARLQTQTAHAAADTLKDFYAGLSSSLVGMLVSPEFLFREISVEDGRRHGGAQADAYSKASQLSYLLWNAPPDDVLWAAARSGKLNSKRGLEQQVDRMLASPRLEAGVRAFFSDMLGYDDFSTLSKDPAVYPKFRPEVVEDAKEQTLRTITDLLLTNNGDYRDVFTTRHTFLTPALGSIYRVAVFRDTPNGSPDTWQPYEYGNDDPRAGILSQLSFVALHAHPARSSPTVRGKALREIMLCQKVPDPPGNVDFSIVQDTGNAQYRTARERVTAHRNNPVCAGCHKLIDPMGLALENFDGGGNFRTTENGAPIDTTGELDGVKFDNVVGLGWAMHDSPAATSCLVTRVAAYALGRATGHDDAAWLASLEKGFVADGYRLPSLLRRVATSDALYKMPPIQAAAMETPASVPSKSEREE